MKKNMSEQQISLFDYVETPSVKIEPTRWKISIDGASRGNPGLATCGVVIYKDDQLFKKEGYFLNTMTNNQAEYTALIVALLLLQQVWHKNDTLCIISDSQLLVRQMQGIYKVKNEELKRFNMLALQLLSGLSYTIDHVLREYNQEADRAANKAFETLKKLPPDFIRVMKAHEIIC